MKSSKNIAIIGRRKDTSRYEDMLSRTGISYITSLCVSKIHSCSAILLPGGGDITPAFFGQKNAGSKNIDTELDIIQLQAMELAVREKKPILGICKGMQIINVFFGGTIVQDMQNAKNHRYIHPEEKRDVAGDQMHDSRIMPETFLWEIYGKNLCINSAHHQCIDKPGKNLEVAQFANDGTPEALFHKTLPIYGVQWHPERLLPEGEKLFRFFVNLL